MTTSRVENARSPADRITVSELMSEEIVTIPENTSFESVMTLFLERGFSGAPVINAAGEPVGLISKTDLLREAHDRGKTDEVEWRPQPELGPGFHTEEFVTKTAGDLMTPLIFSIQAQAPLSQAAALMAFERVHRVVVVDEDGKVVGMVSSLDVLLWVASLSGIVRSP